MLSKLAAIALVLATSLTGAVPAAHRPVDSLALGSRPGGASCASSGAFCCNSTIPAQDADSSLTTFLGALGMGLENLANNLGLGCASMTSGVSWCVR